MSEFVRVCMYGCGCVCVRGYSPLHPPLQVSIARDTPPTDKDGGNFHDSDVSDAEGSSEAKEQASSAEAKLADDEKVSEAAGGLAEFREERDEFKAYDV